MITLVIQGTTSDAGKSALVTGPCRVLSQQVISVAPFKPRNMALNSAVDCDDGEIGRAQPIQAYSGSQIILQGKADANMDANQYHAYKPIVQKAVLNSYKRMAKQLVGVCSGFQLSGIRIHDPQGIEGSLGISGEFNFFNMETSLTSNKILTKFDSTKALQSLLCSAGLKVGIPFIYMTSRELDIKRIDNTNEQHVDMFENTRLIGLDRIQEKEIRHEV